MSLNKPIKVLVTGAAGQIANSMIPLILNGNVFGPKQRIALNLLEITPCLPKLRGVGMEIEDCAYTLLDKLVETDNVDKACDGIDYAILIGGFSVKGSWKNFERDSLLSGNVPIFSKIGKSLDKKAKKTVKVVVVANPANTNCLIAMKNAPSIPKENFTALSRLDYNRAVSDLATRLGVRNEEVKKVSIWGNHSRTLICDVSLATVKSKNLRAELKDDEYLDGGEFLEFLRNRFYQIVESKGCTSSVSAANAVKDHIRDWHFGTEEGTHVAMCVNSDGNPYGVKDGLIFSFPVVVREGKWSFAEGFNFDEKMKAMIEATEKELVSEKEKAESFL